MSNYYSSHTDVWVYGTPQQYAEFENLLRVCDHVHRIPADDRGGMDLCVLPPVKKAEREFVVLHERLVYQSNRFNMEVIVGGSAGGLKTLAKYFKRARKRLEGSADSHFHFDDGEEVLLMPSIFLQICGPISDMNDQITVFAPPAAGDLLPDMDWRDPDHWPYERIETYGDLHGRLPITNKENKSALAIR